MVENLSNPFLQLIHLALEFLQFLSHDYGIDLGLNGIADLYKTSSFKQLDIESIPGFKLHW